MADRRPATTPFNIYEAYFVPIGCQPPDFAILASIASNAALMR
jgi:hypothetical protein